MHSLSLTFGQLPDLTVRLRLVLCSVARYFSYSTFSHSSHLVSMFEKIYMSLVIPDVTAELYFV